MNNSKYTSKQQLSSYKPLKSYSKVKKYPEGGMYSNNTVSSSGQGMGSTSNIVFNESNPEILKAKMAAMEAEKLKLQQGASNTQQELAQMNAQKSQVIQEAADESGSKLEEGVSTAKSLVSTVDEVSGGKLGEFAKEQGSKLFGKGAETATSGIREGSQLLSGQPLGLNTQATQLSSGTLGTGSGLTSSVANPALTGPISGGSGLIDKSSSLFAPPPSISPTLGGTPSFSPNPALMGDKVSLGTDLTKQGVEKLGTTVGSTALKETGKGLMNTGAGVGAAGVGSGLTKFATSGAGIGTIASLAGAGVTALSNDKDATTLNFGEGTGAVLSGVGTGIGAAALAGTVMGSAVPVLGNAIGAVAGAAYGLGKALIGRKKARKAKAKHEAEVKDRKDKHNKELTQNFAETKASVRAGEVAQKTYSGYDIGKNVTYSKGGRMQPLMKYV
tara:strand:- start:3268 stop:4599 length:1332 start_codon:yes stop_codon:yes gene_type:complete